MSATVGLEVYLLAVTWSVVVPELTLSVIRTMIPRLVSIRQVELSHRGSYRGHFIARLIGWFRFVDGFAIWVLDGLRRGSWATFCMMVGVFIRIFFLY